MRIDSLQPTKSLTEKMTLSKEENKINHFEDVLKQATEEQNDVELKEACKEVEQYMLSMIFKQMKQSTTFGESLFPKGDYEKMFEEQLIDEQAKQMTEAGGIGLADMMYKQMTQAYKTKA